MAIHLCVSVKASTRLEQGQGGGDRFIAPRGEKKRRLYKARRRAILVGGGHGAKALRPFSGRSLVPQGPKPE